MTLFFADLYDPSRRTEPGPAMLGLVWVPVYATLNLVVYPSQIVVVPALLARYPA